MAAATIVLYRSLVAAESTRHSFSILVRCERVTDRICLTRIGHAKIKLICFAIVHARTWRRRRPVTVSASPESGGSRLLTDCGSFDTILLHSDPCPVRGNNNSPSSAAVFLGFFDATDLIWPFWMHVGLLYRTSSM